MNGPFEVDIESGVSPVSLQMAGLVVGDLRLQGDRNGVSLGLARDLGMTGLLGPSAVIYCADLVTGLLSAEDVGDSELPGNNVVLGEVDVDNSLPVIAS
jgi:hypothetical protein